MVELRVKLDDVPMDGMKQVEDGEAKVLFVRDAAGVRAFQAKCPHYGAPLAKGLLCDGALYCPWHKAVFDIRDGGLREPPALTALARYPVRIDGDTAIATFEPESAPAARPRDTEKSVVIVGTGAAAVAAATTLRREGFGGKISMIGREDALPYDRPKLSKNFLAKKTEPSAVVLEEDFFAKHRIDRVEGPAVEIDPRAHRVTLSNGCAITGDHLLVATGSRAAVPHFPGDELGKIFTLRSLDDAIALSAAAETAKTIVVVGGGFIGLEAAAFLTKRGLHATVVTPEALPLAARFGDEVGKAIKAFHEKNGIRILTGKVAAFEGERDVATVRLEDGTLVAADLVLIGAGAKPETGAFVGVDLREDGGVAVDDRLQLAPQVWVAGDIAAFPQHQSGNVARIEHWRLAEQHGAYVARAILGAIAPFTAAPFFWSNQGEKRLDYAGYAPDWDEIVTHGDVAGLDFISFYLRNGRAIAACAVGQNEKMLAFLHRLDAGQAPDAAEVRAGKLMPGH